MNNKIVSFLILTLFLIPVNTWAACSWVDNTGTAALCTPTEINACITDAKSKTGAVIVNLPACTATDWTTNVEFDMSSGWTNVTSLSIIGAGTAGTRSAASTGGTNINHNTGQFYVTTAAAKKLRISNITFTGTPNNAGAGYNVASIFIAGLTKVASSGGFRVDHMSFNSASRAVAVNGYLDGVIDSNTRTGPGQVFHVSDGVYGGNSSWHRANSMGGAGNVYIENNDIQCTGTSCVSPTMFCDTDNGGRVVVRYNLVKNHYLGGHDASSTNRSGFLYEAYNNDLYIGERDDLAFISHRGGTGAFYNNSMYYWKANTSNMTYAPTGTHFMNYRSSDGPGGQTALWANAKTCSSSSSALKGVLAGDVSYSDSTCSSGTGCEYIDDPSGDGKGYPCRDQIGRGTDQTLAPYLLWNNTITFSGQAAAPIQINIIDGGATDIVADRDYCLATTTMPATCNGVETTYTAYTCPHPLVGDGTCTASVSGLSGYSLGGSPPTVEVTIASSGAGHTMTTGVSTVNTGSSVDIPITLNNGWKGAWTSTDNTNCSVSSCSYTEGGMKSCSVTANAVCTVTFTSSEIKLLN